MKTLARNCISSSCSWTMQGHRPTASTAASTAGGTRAARAINRERWWRRQNLESETVLNGSDQLVELVFNQPSGRVRVECTVLLTCQRLWKGCCDLCLRPSVALLERGVDIDALNTPGSPRVVAVGQHSCTSVWRATSLEFRDIWHSRVTWKEDACVWKVTCQQSSSLPCPRITSDSGRGLRPSADEELMKYAFEDVDRRVSLSLSRH